MPVSKSVFQVVIFRPNRANSQATRKKFTDAAAILRRHPDFVGIALEGVQLEHDGVFAIVEWSSYEAHMRFCRSPIYADLVNMRDGAVVSIPSATHYNFYDALPPNYTPVVIEYVAFKLISEDMFEPFLAGYRDVMRITLRTEGCRSYTVGRQVEDRRQLLILVTWDSLEAHVENLMKNPDVQTFISNLMMLLNMYVEGSRAGIEMWHVKTCAPGTAL